MGASRGAPCGFRLLMAALAPMLIAAGALAALAGAKADQSAWPKIDGKLHINKEDRPGTIHGTPESDELLGGHSNDVIFGGPDRDVIWGDYKPCCQPTNQRDVLIGGRARDFIYASHGHNRIHGGRGSDVIRAHFGRGTIDCGSGQDLFHVSKRNRPHYRIRNCEHRTK